MAVTSLEPINPNPGRSPVESADFVDVRTLAHGFWAGRWLVLVAAVVGLLFGVRGLRNYEPGFEASMVVTPLQANSIGPGNAGGLQALGINVGARPVTSFDRFRLILESVEFAEILETKYGLKARVFEDQWDAERKRWLRPNDGVQSSSEKLRVALRMRAWSEPDNFTLANYIKNGIKFREIGAQQFFRISFFHRDRQFTLWLLETVYSEGENLLRRKDTEENTQRMDYLSGQLRNATVIEVRQALANLLTNEERQAMLMQGNLPYISKIVIPPSVDTRPTEPEFFAILIPPVMVAIGLAFLALTIGVLLLGEVFRRHFAAAPPRP